MLRKLKKIILGFRINSAREDLQVSLLGMRDKVHQVHMYADKLQALLEQAGHTKRDHFNQVEVGLAKYEANGHMRSVAKHSDLLVVPTPTNKKE